jgi:hypothetical protein
MNKFKEGDGIVRASMDARWARIGFKATVLCGNMYLDALGKINEIIDDYWELAEDTSKLVTVTHEGNVYEVGKYYLFSDNGNEWALSRLACINSQNSFKFESDRSVWNLIKETKGSIGTITTAPIELIDGNAYMFNYQGIKHIGLYEKNESSFFMVGCSYNLENCTNIRPMTVTESK